MRNKYLVGYDISDDKRLNKVFTIMQGYGERLQYSVFICDLSPREKATLEATLTEHINHTEDCIMMVDLGSGEGALAEKIQFIGIRKTIPERRAVIV
ncbi:MAG: CRISPR-associated endonuclease Cas2 [Euryarchaeota archaeon]|nr:CRISPR-associated endonuclease Cas2 [Euryarchaeota archaeon]